MNIKKQIRSFKDLDVYQLELISIPSELRHSGEPKARPESKRRL